MCLLGHGSGVDVIHTDSVGAASFTFRVIWTTMTPGRSKVLRFLHACFLSFAIAISHHALKVFRTCHITYMYIKDP